MDRESFALLLAMAGGIYILSGLVMLVRVLLSRRWAWLGHVVPLLYVGWTFIYLAWLLVHNVSAGRAAEYFVWGQLVLGVWLLVVLIHHMRRWDQLKRIAPELVEWLE